MQKTEEVELLVMDGDSVDNTPTIIKENEDIIDYHIQEKDKGIYDAWNKGIKKATGQWIMFLGADDSLCPNTMAHYLGLIAENGMKNLDYICGRVEYVDYNKNVFRLIGAPWKWEVFSKEMTIAHVASLHNKKLFEEVGLFDINYTICADYELLLRKKDRLKTFFTDQIVAQMGMEGMSLSLRAIKESRDIRKKYVPMGKLSFLLSSFSKYVHYYVFLLRIKIWRFFTHYFYKAT
jgi:glycosyltransferase involved in cell wall biosynthesis